MQGVGFEGSDFGFLAPLSLSVCYVWTTTHTHTHTHTLTHTHAHVYTDPRVRALGSTHARTHTYTHTHTHTYAQILEFACLRSTHGGRSCGNCLGSGAQKFRFCFSKNKMSHFFLELFASASGMVCKGCGTSSQK